MNSCVFSKNTRISLPLRSKILLSKTFYCDSYWVMGFKSLAQQQKITFLEIQAFQSIFIVFSPELLLVFRMLLYTVFLKLPLLKNSVKTTKQWLFDKLHHLPNFLSHSIFSNWFSQLKNLIASVVEIYSTKSWKT